MNCPKCLSVKSMHSVLYDFGTDHQTGYSDKGEIFQCRECGEILTPEEVIACLCAAIINEEEYELATQEDVSSFALLFQAGCSVEEASAYMREDRRVN